jgi:hypothetical protein
MFLLVPLAAYPPITRTSSGTSSHSSNSQTQPPLAMPPAHVYRVAGLAGRASTVTPGHFCSARRLSYSGYGVLESPRHGSRTIISVVGGRGPGTISQLGTREGRDAQDEAQRCNCCNRCQRRRRSGGYALFAPGARDTMDRRCRRDERSCRVRRRSPAWHRLNGSRCPGPAGRRRGKRPFR